MGNFRSSLPVLRNKLLLALAGNYLSTRTTVAGTTVRPVALLDLTATTFRLHPEFDLQAGIRNLLNWSYQDPVCLAVDRMQQDGRSIFVKLIWHTRR
jgi:hypothetical protein